MYNNRQSSLISCRKWLTGTCKTVSEEQRMLCSLLKYVSLPVVRDC